MYHSSVINANHYTTYCLVHKINQCYEANCGLHTYLEKGELY